MSVTRVQRRSLENLQKYHNEGASILGQIRRNIGVFIYLLVAALIIVPIAFVLDRWLGIFLIGVITGTVIRDLRGFIQWKRVWPAMDAVVDWQRVEDLLDSNGW